MERGSSSALGLRAWFEDISTWTYLLSPEFRMTHTRLLSLWWSSQGLRGITCSLESSLPLSVCFPSAFLFPPIPTFGGHFRLLSPSCLNCWGQVPVLLDPPKPALLVLRRRCFGSCQTWYIKRGLLRHLPRVLISHNITPSLLDWLLKALPKLNQSYFFSLLLTCPTNLHVWSLQWATPCPLSLHRLSSGYSPHLECHSSTLASSHLSFKAVPGLSCSLLARPHWSLALWTLKALQMSLLHILVLNYMSACPLVVVL